jgi:hypothetical protein
MADIQSGYDFGATESLSDIKIENIMDAARILTAFISAKTAISMGSVDAPNDYVLMYDTSQDKFFKIAFDQLPAIVGAKPNPTYDILSDGATIAQTCDSAKVIQKAKVTIAGNRTLQIGSAVNGMSGEIVVKQDATGGRTLTLPSGSFIPGSGTAGTGPAPLVANANRETTCTWIFNGNNFYWTFTSF